MAGQTSTSAAKDLNRVQLTKNSATIQSGTSVRVKFLINILELSFLLRKLVLRTDVLTSSENTRPEESLRSGSPSNRISVNVITGPLSRRR